MKLSLDSRNAAADAVLSRLNGGLLRIYTGVMPATPEAAAVGQQLVELPFATVAFALAVGGRAVANPIERRNATARGRAGWFRAVTAAGATVYDGTVGTVGTDLIVANVNFEQYSSIYVEELTYTQPA